MTLKKIIGSLLVLMACSLTSFAQNHLEGMWKTVDKNGNDDTYVYIAEENGQFAATIYQVLGDQNPNCDDCKGALKNKARVGMTLFTGLQSQGNGEFTGGQAIRKNGKSYDCTLTLIEDGYRLKVKGLSSKTQIWEIVPI